MDPNEIKDGRWVLCKECGWPLGLYPGYLPEKPGYGDRAVVYHTKPGLEPLTCPLYLSKEADEIVTLHANVKSIPSPIMGSMMRKN